jgi:hypothetical protein
MRLLRGDVMKHPQTASRLLLERMVTRAAHVSAILCVLAIVPVRAADSSRARRADERREDAAVKDAREAVNDAEREVRQAQQSLQRSQSRYREAEAERQRAGILLEKTADRLEKEHADSGAIAAARERLSDARARFKEAAQPVLATVRSQPAYVAAESERTEAVALLVPEVESDRADAARRASAAAATMREMERAATAADPRLTALDAEVVAAEARFKTAQSRFDKAVESDPDLQSARRALSAARAAEDKAEATLVRENRDLLAARTRLARAQQSLATKRAADQRDTNKSPNPSKPPQKDRKK